jgi:ABC-type lipoprotein export system ATPase subunit
MDITLSKVIVRIGKDNKTLFQISNYQIQKGKKLLIKGASGKGKTTFLHLLAGLFSPTEGQIQIGETNMTELNEEKRSLFRRSHVGIIFQKLNLIDHLTALENIQLSLTNSKDIVRAMNALKSVGLEGRENDRTGVLSLGEQQRVAVARVLAGDPQIVFADEPTSSLDEKNAFEVIDLLIRACQDKTLIVVSHDHRIEKYFKNILNFEELIS